jgi:hypothetical protein
MRRLGAAFTLFVALAASSAAHAQNTFSATAVSPTSLVTGMSWSAASRRQAEQMAVSYCNRQGASDCKVASWSMNECIAIAISHEPGHSGWGSDWASSRAGAQFRALAACNTDNRENCFIQQSSCPQDP